MSRTIYIHRLCLIHQTSTENAEKIISSQKFIPSSNGLFGPGIYFANTIEACNIKAHQRSTYLIADVYVGKAISINKDDALNGKVNYQSIRNQGYNSIIGYHMQSGKEIIVFDPQRVKNIKYAFGTRPRSIFSINRDRIVLFYITDRNTAKIIGKDQEIPKTNGPFGYSIYMYDSITDAKAHQSGETFLAADCFISNLHVHNNSSTFNLSMLPGNWGSFKVHKNGMIVYGFRNRNMIKNIHYCGGSPW